jgi:hypothetical protein
VPTLLEPLPELLEDRQHRRELGDGATQQGQVRGVRRWRGGAVGHGGQPR